MALADRYRSEKKWQAQLVSTDGEHTWRNKGDHVLIDGFILSGSTEDGLIESGRTGWATTGCCRLARR